MPNTTIYLPDALHQAVKRSGLNISQVCQRALRAELDGPIPEEEEVDTIEELAGGLRDLGYRLNRELKRMAKVVEETWSEQ